MTESFAPFEADFLEFTTAIIWCTATTVDGKNRPRSRILHPIWQIVDGRPVGWVVTSRTPVKAAHIARNPSMTSSYWSPAQNTVMIDCVASCVDDEKRPYVWDLFMTTPPLGYDLSGYGAEGLRNPLFNPLRLDAWRVQILRFEGWTENIVPRMWKRDT